MIRGRGEDEATAFLTSSISEGGGTYRGRKIKYIADECEWLGPNAVLQPVSVDLYSSEEQVAGLGAAGGGL